MFIDNVRIVSHFRPGGGPHGAGGQIQLFSSKTLSASKSFFLAQLDAVGDAAQGTPEMGEMGRLSETERDVDRGALQQRGRGGVRQEPRHREKPAPLGLRETGDFQAARPHCAAGEI